MAAISSPWSPEAADPDPIAQFSAWFQDARDVREPEPEAMALATASPGALPSLRWVLLKDFDEEGFVFYTNERSAKGADLIANPVAALAWRWYHLERQVRVVGPVGPVEAARSDEYFASRPRGAQLGAWASDQSAAISDRASLEARLAQAESRFAGVEVPRPPHWRGFRVRPASFEFWQGRRDRLHDRVVYRRDAHCPWRRELLAP